ncbi:MAG: hypothetical protein V4493_05700 [Pseudomonadota bacterium]
MKLLEKLELSWRNGAYVQLFTDRISSLCELKSCTENDLTLREILSCVEATDFEYSEIFPILFPGVKGETMSEIVANHTGAIV